MMVVVGYPHKENIEDMIYKEQSHGIYKIRLGLLRVFLVMSFLYQNLLNIINNDLQEIDFIEKLVCDQYETTPGEIKFNESKNLQMIYF